MVYLVILIWFVLVFDCVVPTVMICVILMGFNYLQFILFELLVVTIFVSMIHSSHTYERSGSLIYLGYFGIVVGCSFLSALSFSGIGLIVGVLIWSNLPVYGLHIWLPNVHVEASILLSCVLAGVILNAGSIFFLWYGSLSVIGVIFSVASILILNEVDGNCLVAISSVVHISMTILSLTMALYCGLSHICVSAIIFCGVYHWYHKSSSRLLWEICAVILTLNLGFPLISAFWVEVYLLPIAGLGFIVGYIFMFLFTYSLYVNSGKTHGDVLLVLVVVTLILM